MSEEIFAGDDLYVTRFVGPASEGEDRQRWQFTPVGGDVAVLDRRAVRALLIVLLRDAWRVPRNVEDV